MRNAECGLWIAESTHGTNRIERVGMDGGGAVTGCFLGEWGILNNAIQLRLG
jgi:hypothetical protein